MSDNYQAVYDAVRSRFHCSIDGDQIAREIASMFHTASLQMHQAGCDAQTTEWERQRPSVLFRPRVFLDGNQWCALYGEDIQEGVAGFGGSPDAAMRAFDKAWTAKAGGEDVPPKATTHIQVRGAADVLCGNRAELDYIVFPFEAADANCEACLALVTDDMREAT